MKAKGENTGFDAMSLKVGDMKKLGIIDPTKVVRSAVENASSVASMVLTTEVLITDIPEPKKDAAPQMPEY
jgi:chaperonin GroEL